MKLTSQAPNFSQCGQKNVPGQFQNAARSRHRSRVGHWWPLPTPPMYHRTLPHEDNKDSHNEYLKHVTLWRHACHISVWRSLPQRQIKPKDWLRGNTHIRQDNHSRCMAFFKFRGSHSGEVTDGLILDFPVNRWPHDYIKHTFIHQLSTSFKRFDNCHVGWRVQSSGQRFAWIRSLFPETILKIQRREVAPL